MPTTVTSVVQAPSSTERRWHRTIQAVGCTALPDLKPHGPKTKGPRRAGLSELMGTAVGTAGELAADEAAKAHLVGRVDQCPFSIPVRIELGHKLLLTRCPPARLNHGGTKHSITWIGP
jgi:hypothetical protein